MHIFSIMDKMGKAAMDLELYNPKTYAGAVKGAPGDVGSARRSRPRRALPGASKIGFRADSASTSGASAVKKSRKSAVNHPLTLSWWMTTGG
jgi:hypothetical protein